MNTTLSAAEIVAKLRNWIREGKPDHWIGMQARLLIEPGARGRRRSDSGSGDWIDTGSGPGVSTAWERHDDPEMNL